MKVTRTAIPDVCLIEPRVFGDARGFFYESFNQKAFNEATGVLSGTPTLSGPFTFVVAATNVSGAATRNVTITVA